MRKMIVAVFGIILISGCATTQMNTSLPKPAIVPDPDAATLVIIRDTSFGGAIGFSHYLDRKFIGETKANSYFLSKVPPGHHYVVISTENTCVADFEFQPGKVYYLREGIAMGMWRARTSGFSGLTPLEAEEAINSCSYWQYDPGTGAFEDMHETDYQIAIDGYEADKKENPESYKEILSYQGF